MGAPVKRKSSKGKSLPSARAQPDNVVPLSRHRAALARGRRTRRADLLWNAPDPAAAIRALPGDEFYYVLHEVGFPEAMEIMLHGTPAQVHTALDFALWDRDLVSVAEADTWLSAISAAPRPVLGRWLRGFDVELLALLIRQRARIYDLSVEEAPEESEGTLWTSPDRSFTLDLLGESDAVPTTINLINAMYDHDLEWTRRVLVGMRSELDSGLEESAYRWRSGRMADLGFLDYHEALAVYQEVDIDALAKRAAAPTPRPTEVGSRGDDATLGMRVPTALMERLGSGSPFAAALADIGDEKQLARLHQDLVLLANRVLSADRVKPGDDGQSGAVLARVVATLDVAVEFLSRGDRRRAALVLPSLPLLTVFRTGHTLTLKVAKLARTLKRKGPFAALLPEIEVLEAEDAEIVVAIARPRPLFPRCLEDPPADGERTFANLADIATATAAVARAAAAQALLVGLGVRASDLSPDVLRAAGVTDLATVDTGSIARTVIARACTDLPRTPFAPLPRAAGIQFKNILETSHQRPNSMNELLTTAKTSLTSGRPSGSLTAPTKSIIDRWLGSLRPGASILVSSARSKSATLKQ